MKLVWLILKQADFLSEHGIQNQRVFKVREGRPHIVDMIKNGEVDLVINTPGGKKAISESYSIRRAALTFDIPYTTTLAGARATALAIKAMAEGRIEVKTIQEYHQGKGEGGSRKVEVGGRNEESEKGKK